MKTGNQVVFFVSLVFSFLGAASFLSPVFAAPGDLTTLVGSENGDGYPAAVATLKPNGVVEDTGGQLYISDLSRQLIRRIDATSERLTHTIAGNGLGGFSGDQGPALQAQFLTPQHLALDASGRLYITDQSNHRVRRLELDGRVTTVAGIGQPIVTFMGDGGPAAQAIFGSLTGIARSATGTLYLADGLSYRIRQISPSGIVTTLAGTGVLGLSGDGGPALQAQFRALGALVVSASGELYLCDVGNNRVRKIGTDGRITTVAGTGTGGFSGDGGPATAAALNQPTGLALAPDGTLFIADRTNNRIRQVTPDGIMTTIAGTGVSEFGGDGGSATAASFREPSALARDAAGNLYIADTVNHRVRRISPTGIITTVAGNGSNSQTLYGTTTPLALEIAIVNPTALAVTADGGLLIADNSHRVQKILPINGGLTAQSRITTLVNRATAQGTAGDGGAAVDAQTLQIQALFVEPTGSVLLADAARLRRVESATGLITTVAGQSDTQLGDGGLATFAALQGPGEPAFSITGDLLAVSRSHHRVRRVDAATGIITTFAGTGTAAYSGDDGPATSAALNSPMDVTLAPDGTLYIADRNNVRVRKIGTDGRITTVAGNGFTGFTGDNGLATAAKLNGPVDVEVLGNALYIAEGFAPRVRKVDLTTGLITTVAGTGVTGYNGENLPGPSTQLTGINSLGISRRTGTPLLLIAEDGGRVRQLNADGTLTSIVGQANGDGYPAAIAKITPAGVSQAATGELYLADSTGARIRKVDTTGLITTIAGTGVGGFSGDNGPATQARLFNPSDIVITAQGTLYVSDQLNQRIRKITSTGLITTLAGTGTAAYSGDDGPASSAQLNYPQGLAWDAVHQALYVADSGNRRIRRIDCSLATPTITTIAGTTGIVGYNGDNIAALTATLNNPTDVQLGKERLGSTLVDVLYIADGSNSRIRRVQLDTGLITTIAGTGSSLNIVQGDGGLATQIALGTPVRLAVESDATGVTRALYVTINNGISWVRKLDMTTGRLSRVAGVGNSVGFNGDGPALAAWLNRPSGLFMTLQGTVLVSDTTNQRVRQLDLGTPLPPTNTPPVTPPAPSGPSSGLTGVVLSYQGTGTDPDNDPVKLVFDWDDGTTTTTSLASSGTARSAGHSWSGSGTYQVKVRAIDSQNAASTEFSSSLAVTITTPTPTNQTPSAQSQSVTTSEDTAAVLTLTGSDPEGSALTFAIVSPPTNGSLSGSGANRTYTPNANYAGSDSFTFTVSDGSLTSNTATVSITVTPVNDAPTVSIAPVSPVTLPNSASLDGTASDIDSPTLTATWSKVSGPGTVTFTNANTIDNTASFSTEGSYVLRLTISDGSASGSAETGSILVNPAPVTGLPTPTGFTATANTAGTAVTLNWNVYPAPADFFAFRWERLGGVSGSNCQAQSWGNPFVRTVFPSNGVIPSSTTDANSLVPGTTYCYRLAASTRTMGSAYTYSDPVRLAGTTPNQSPGVQAGSTQTITLPATATLDGTVTDDGLPNPPGQVTVTWSKVSGTGTVTFGNTSAVDTTASFSVASTYVLRLTASDGTLTTNATVTIVVNAAPVNQAPTVNAGPNQTITLPAIVSLDGTATDDGLPIGSTPTTTWSKFSGPGTVTFGSTSSVDTSASFSTNGTYVLRLTASDGTLSRSDDVTITVNPTPQNNRAPTATAQSVTLAEDSSRVITLTGSDPDGDSLTFTIATGPAHGGLTGTGATRTYTPDADYANSDSFTFTVSDGSLPSVTAATVSITVTPVNDAPSVSVGPVSPVTLPLHSVNLGGTVTDVDSTPSLSWSKVSGPTGAVSFAPSNTADTTATLPATAGTYVLRLTATDSSLIRTADVTVTVNAVPVSNQAPTVDAGSDVTITLPAAATLNGTVSDDGLPVGSTLTTTWSKVSGPGTVTFGNANTVDTTAGFSTSGTYVLRLTASDGPFTRSDEATIAVNSAPVASGPDLVVTSVTVTNVGSVGSVTAIVSNQGTTSIAGTVNIGLTVNGRVFPIRSFSGLPVGTSKTVRWDSVGLLLGVNTAIVTADPTNSLHEANESNNSRTEILVR